MTDPDLLPFDLDPLLRRVLWVRLDAEQRRRAAFLDERALPPSPQAFWADMGSLAVAAPHRTADAIFHIGHCGSTLLSRAIEAWPGVETLREPKPLRTLADAWADLDRPSPRLSREQVHGLLEAFWHRWSQPLAGGRVVVKATSRCNALIQPLLDVQPDLRAVLLDMPLERWLATVLKAPGSTHDALAAAATRRDELVALGTHLEPLYALPVGIQCALGWVAERLRFRTLAAAYPRAILRLDFEDMLHDRLAAMRAVAAHFGLPAEHAQAAASDACWGRYAKATEHGYGADDREHDLALAASRHRDAIVTARAWLDALVSRTPVLSGLA